ncbi:MAG TPA: hypothetical protein VMR17_14190 [Xanthobacteraceae bacterium]|nr:hypothetical protein [Xanthobacteraceae bacterium]
MARIGSKRFARELGAFVEAAALARDRRQIIISVGIGRVGAQHLGVTRRGGVDRALPVQRQGGL